MDNFRKSAKDETSYKVRTEAVFRKKTLNSPQTRLAVAGESKQVDSLLKHTILALHRVIIKSDINLR